MRVLETKDREKLNNFDSVVTCKGGGAKARNL
jgi:hypothetical protein